MKYFKFLQNSLLFSFFLLSSCENSFNDNVININEKTITIYSINDFHGAFSNDESINQIGLPAIGEYLINEKNKNKDNTFIFSCGDMWQGDIESTKTKGKIVTEAMNLIGFDGMVIGNHEFDWGEEAIITNFNLMDFPLLGANIFYIDSLNKPSYLLNSILIEKGDFKLGVIGTIGAYLESSIVSSVSNKFNFIDPNEIIINEAKKLKNDGADSIILLAHDAGFYNEKSNFEIALNNKDIKLDGIFLGHDHKVKDLIYKGVPHLESGSNGENIAKLNLTFKKEKNKKYKLINSKSKIISTKDKTLFNKENKDILNLIDKYKEEIGDTNFFIYNFKNFQSRTNLAYIACEAISYFFKNNKYQFNIDVIASFHNYSGIRGEALKGDFLYKDFLRCFPFTNTVCYLKVNKSTFEDLTYNVNNIKKDFIFEGEYIYIGTINYIGEKYKAEAIEYYDTNYYVQDVILNYLEDHPGLY